MNILGIHFGHDSSASLLVNGKLIGAVQEERFSRIKNYSGFPFNSVNYLLKLANIKAHEIDIVAIPGSSLKTEMPFDILKERFGYKKSPVFKLKLLLSIFLKPWTSILLYGRNKFDEFVNAEFKKKGFLNAEIVYVDHHLAHAASAFYSSPFESAIIFTQDGKGDSKSGGVYYGNGKELTVLSHQGEVDSIGQIYAEVTRYLGFLPNRHEGKITGLAANGDPSLCYGQLKELVSKIDETIHRAELDDRNLFSHLTKNPLQVIGVLSSHPSHMKYHRNSVALSNFFKNIFRGKTKEDISASIQSATEAWVLEWCKYNLNKMGKDKVINICLAGGLFANVKINQVINQKTKFGGSLYVQPAMGDAGLSLGAAQLMWHKIQSSKRMRSVEHAYLGPSYKKEYIKKIMDKFHDKILWKSFKEIEPEIAKLLHGGKVIGRFTGGSEWGPRALGNRSILIRPTDKKINNQMNERLNRSEFMPFAPSVLDYRAKDYFYGYKETDVAANFMTTTYNVVEDKIKEIEAVVHVDNTARPQIVSDKYNSSFYRLLIEYERLSGIGCLINTSFNLHEEPIVEDPSDAIKALLRGAVDILALESHLIWLK